MTKFSQSVPTRGSEVDASTLWAATQWLNGQQLRDSVISKTSTIQTSTHHHQPAISELSKTCSSALICLSWLANVSKSSLAARTSSFLVVLSKSSCSTANGVAIGFKIGSCLLSKEFCSVFCTVHCDCLLRTSLHFSMKSRSDLSSTMQFSSSFCNLVILLPKAVLW